jgi:hypothetical protein
MTTVCPRCGTPRISDFCHICGLDFRTMTAPVPPTPPASLAGPAPVLPPLMPAPPAPQPRFQAQPQPFSFQQPASQPPAYQFAPPPPPASTTCPRCFAPLYPGYAQCSNCGLDIRALGGMPVAQGRTPILPIAAALLGVALLVVAGTVFVVAQPKSASPTASPSAVAVASPTASPTLSPTPVRSPTSSTRATQRPPGGTPEPSPIDKWTTFASPDGRWTVAFPGTKAPNKSVYSSGSGTEAMTETTFVVLDPSGARYIADYTDFTTSFVNSAGAPALMDLMQNVLERSTGGTAVAVTATTMLGYAARDVTLMASTMTMNIRMWMVRSRLYVLLAGADEGTDFYPLHFYSSFKLK